MFQGDDYERTRCKIEYRTIEISSTKLNRTYNFSVPLSKRPMTEYCALGILWTAKNILINRKRFLILVTTKTTESKNHLKNQSTETIQ
jgi:hypothetical protein